MAKRIALKDHITVDAVDLSNFCRAVEFSSEHERVDVSGFNAPARTSTWPARPSRKSPVEFFGSYGASEVHATLYPIHRDREVVAFEWRPDQTAVVSATNPQLEGNVQLLTYNPSASPAAKKKRGRPRSSPPTRPGSPTPPPRRCRGRRRSGSTATASSCGHDPRRQRITETRSGTRVPGSRRQSSNTTPRRSSPDQRQVSGRLPHPCPANRASPSNSRYGKRPGKHPDYGGLQMRRALLPALAANDTDLEQKLERALDQVCDHFDRPA